MHPHHAKIARAEQGLEAHEPPGRQIRQRILAAGETLDDAAALPDRLAGRAEMPPHHRNRIGLGVERDEVVDLAPAGGHVDEFVGVDMDRPVGLAHVIQLIGHMKGLFLD